MKNRKNPWYSWPKIMVLAWGAVLIWLPAVAGAQVSYYWNGAPGTQNWSNAANWSPAGGPPGNNDIAYLYPNDNNPHIANYNIISNPPSLAGVYINAGQNGMTLLLGQPNVALSTDVLSVGEKVQGAVEQTNGSLTAMNVYLGHSDSNSSGTYAMSGGALSTDSTFVGNAGTGTFNQSGGTHAAFELQVGALAGSTGYYNLSGGATLNTSNSSVGNLGFGYFSQDGGAHTASSQLNLGQGASFGEYTLTSGSVTTSSLNVGYSGQGVFNQNGGTVDVSTVLTVGREAGSFGTYNFAGGTLTTPSIQVGLAGDGDFNLQAGSLTVSTLSVGAAGTGTFTQSGGTSLGVNGTLWVGSTLTGLGSTFTQQGGDTTITGDLDVGAGGTRGTYDLQGGTLTTQGNVNIGTGLGMGTFTQTGGSHSITGDLLVDSSSSTYNLQGGSVTANALSVNFGSFNQSGASTTASSATFNSINLSNGNYNLTGGSLTAQAITVGMGGDATFSQSGASSATIANSLTVGGGSGTGTYNLSSGTLLFAAPPGYVATLSVGSYMGTGTFNQSGGTVDLAAGILQLGGGTGTYNLQDGLLQQVGSLSLNSTSNFNQSGGVLSADAITLSGGTFNLTGGSLNANSIDLYASSTFFQDSGAAGSLNYATFTQHEGSVQGILENQGTYTYEAGTFSGRLFNYGLVNFNADFTASDGMAQLNPSTPVTLGTGRNLTLNGQGLAVDRGATFDQNGGMLSTSKTVIGDTGIGYFNQTNGTHSISTDLILGQEAGSSGVYNLTDGVLTAMYTYVGNYGTGAFNQSGGSHAVSNDLYLGQEAGSSGTYTLINGSLGTTNTYVGYWGQGTFEQNGTTSTHTVSNDLVLGHEAGSNGAYKLTDGVLTSMNTFVGNFGAGSFEQSGGSHSVSNSLVLGQETGSSGTYTLINGSLSTTNTYVGYWDQGTFEQNGTTSTHTVSNDLVLGNEAGSSGTYKLTDGVLTSMYSYVGYAGTGGFEQSGGSHTVGSDLVLGQQTGSSGTYNLTGGDLQTGNTIVGNVGTGIFTQSGTSSHTVSGTLTLGANGGSGGAYNLQGGDLTSANTEVGRSGQGNFIQSGASSHTVSGTLTLGVDSGSEGSYTLSGGSLSSTSTALTTVNTVVGDLGTGTFTQSGTDSSHTVSDTLTVGGGGSGTYSLSGGALQTNQTVIGGNSEGTFTQQGGNHTVATDLVLGAGTGGSGIYDLMISHVQTGNLIVGLEGQGAFTQNQHTGVEVSSALTLGANAGSTGTYTLGGSFSSMAAYLHVADSIVGDAGTGSFTHALGSHQVTNDVILGRQSGGKGTYALSGGSLEASNLIAGQDGTGTFTQTGGTCTLSGNLTLAQNTGSSGLYELQTGTLSVAGNIYLNNGGTFDQTGGSLSYSEFHHQGGTVLNNLHNQSAYIYDGGVFNGRLWNEGAGTLAFNADFTATNGLAHFSTTAFTLANNLRTLTFAGQGLAVGPGATFNLAAGTVRAASLNVNNGGTFNQTGGTLIPNACSIAVGGTFAATNGSIGDGSSNTILITEGTFETTDSRVRCDAIQVRNGGTFTQNGSVADGSSNTILISEGSQFNLNGGTVTCGNTLQVGPGGTFNQNNDGIVDGSSNTTLITEGTFNLMNGRVQNLRPDNAMIIRNGGAFIQTGGIVDGSSNTITITEGTCTVNGGSYTAGTLNLYTGGTFNWNGGSFSYTNLNLAGGSFNNTTGTLINNYGMISGSGTITSNIMNYGNISPGNSPGVLNIVGSLTQAANATYTVEIASPASYDQINVTGTPGTATVNGTLKPVLLGGYTPVWNQKFAGIVTAENGVAGTFSSIDSSFHWKLAYNANSIDLIAGGYNFADPSFRLTANQRNVGIMFNQVADIASGDLGTVLSELSELPAGVVGDAYQQISPDKASALPALSLAGSMMQWQSVANRLSYQRWRQGGMPNLAAGRSGSFNLSYNNLAGMMLAYNGSDLTGLVHAPRPQAETAGTWGVFTDFVSSFGTQDTTTTITGYNFSIFGFTVGADYRFRDDLVFGLGTGYYNTSASFKGSGGDAGINSIPFYAYGAYTPGSFYAMGYLGYTLNLYSLNRNLAFGGINRVATGSPGGNQLNASLETGYDLKLAKFTVTPAFTLYYSTAWVDSFTEDGAGSLNLKVGAQSADSVQTGIGMRLSRPFQSGMTIILPQIFAFYQHEFANDSRGLDARLAQTGSTFAFQTDSPSRNFALLGAGLAAGLSKNLTLQATYSAEVGRGGYLPQVVSAGLRYEF